MIAKSNPRSASKGAKILALFPTSIFGWRIRKASIRSCRGFPFRKTSRYLKPAGIVIILYTTRPIRTGEKEGRQYHFTDETGLNAFRKAGKVIEERTYQTIAGPWTYATVDNGLDPRKTNYLAIGTLVSYIKVRDYFGSDLVIPIYIDVSDKNLLTRAMHREADQENPRYKEMCRRFLADSEDFDEEKITAAGITRRYDNNGPLDDCVAEIARTIAEYCNAWFQVNTQQK